MHNYPITNLPLETVREYFHMCAPVPKQIRVRGTLPNTTTYKWLAVVGARHHSLYGKLVCEQLIAGLAGYPIIIVSGLAHGIDTIAHITALNHGITCVAFPGSGLDQSVLYPRRNFYLAEKILRSGGCLLSEYDDYQKTAHWIFPMRNRLIAGCAQATLIIECTNESGTRITAKLATEYNRDVLAVPGNINHQLSEGPNELIKLGAIPITSSEDILYALGITPRTDIVQLEAGKSETTEAVAGKPHYSKSIDELGQVEQNPLFELFPITAEHEYILNSITQPTHKNELTQRCSSMNTATLNTRITELELMNKIKVVLGVIYKH